MRKILLTLLFIAPLSLFAQVAGTIKGIIILSASVLIFFICGALNGSNTNGELYPIVQKLLLLLLNGYNRQQVCLLPFQQLHLKNLEHHALKHQNLLELKKNLHAHGNSHGISKS